MIMNSIAKVLGTRLTMIRILRCWTILSTALACQLWAQAAAPPPLYVESFRHGATRVTEKTFEAHLTQIPSDDPVNNAWWLDPGKFARVPVLTERIIKVDGFYVVLKVMAYHFTPPESPYLDSMTVQVNITNTDPRAAKNSGGSGAGGSVGSTGN